VVGPDPDDGTETPAPSLTREVVGGLRWTYGATVATVVMQLGYSAAVARLLEPNVFGLIASAQVVLRFGQYFAEMGLGPALVQKAELTTEDIRAAFTSSLLLGGLLAGGLALAAPALEPVFDSPDVVPVMRAMALTLLLSGFALTAHNMLRRQSRFRTIAQISVASYVAGYLCVGLTLAVLGFGVWSLVGAVLTQMGISSVATFLAARHPARFKLAGGQLRSLYAFGGRVSVISALEYASQAMLVVIIGRNAGQAALGQYNRANLLIDLPLVHVTFGLSGVLFPTLSRVQHDVPRVRSAYLGAVRTVGALVLPLGAGVAVAAPEIVRVMLGSQWDDAALLLPALAGAAVMAGLSHFGGIVAEAMGILNTKMALQAGYVAILIGLLLAVPPDFLVGYALAYFAAEVVRHLAYMAFMGRTLGLTWGDQAAAYLPPLATAAAVGVGIWGVTQVVTSLGGVLPVVFVMQVLTGAAVLALMSAVGPLRGVRVELRNRVQGAYGDQGRGSGIVVRLLSVGDRSNIRPSGP
jgi:lipopolysaccharide exporter